MSVFLIFVVSWYLAVYSLIYINYRLIIKEHITRMDKIAEAQVNASKAAREWQMSHFYQRR
jgi:hypothetical protein